jgi:predicted GIY-YIG superfamily endonuclease
MNGGGGEGCARGAVSQVISKWVTVKTDTWGPAGQFAATTIAGGTTSVITGGKFATGAQTAAFGYLFNHCGTNACGRDDGDMYSPETNRQGLENTAGDTTGLYALGGTLAAPAVALALNTALAWTIVDSSGTVLGYIGIDAVGVVRYVGITKDVAVRWAQHNLDPQKVGLTFQQVRGAEFSTRLQARIWEQKEIIKHGLQKHGGTLLNKRNEIAEKFWKQYGIQKQ